MVSELPIVIGPSPCITPTLNESNCIASQKPKTNVRSLKFVELASSTLVELLLSQCKCVDIDIELLINRLLHHEDRNNTCIIPIGMPYKMNHQMHFTESYKLTTSAFFFLVCIFRFLEPLVRAHMDKNMSNKSAGNWERYIPVENSPESYLACYHVKPPGLIEREHPSFFTRIMNHQLHILFGGGVHNKYPSSGFIYHSLHPPYMWYTNRQR